MVSTPYRIAFLRPIITPSADASAGIEAAEQAALVLWFHLFERCVVHPRLAVREPASCDTTVLAGRFQPRYTATDPLPAAFTYERRDELLSLEVSLHNPVSVTLRGLRNGDRTTSWSAVGEGDALSVLIDRVLALWLAERGLPELPSGAMPSGELRNAFTPSTLLTAGAALAQSLASLVDKVPPALEESEEGDASAGVRASEEDDASAEVDADEDADASENANADEDVAASKDLAASAAPPLVPPDVTSYPTSLAVAVLRAYGTCAQAPVHEAILAHQDDNPWALLDLFTARQHRGPDFPLLRRALSLAPAWGRLYLSLHKPEAFEDVTLPGEPSPLEQLGAAGYAHACAPTDMDARIAFAKALAGAQRHESRVRLHERTRDASFAWPSAWLALLSTHASLDTPGASRRLAGWAANTVGIVVQGFIQRWSEARMRVDLHASNALLRVGLLGEAIVLRANRLEGLESRYRREVATLEGWRKEPRFVAWGYAREGYFRGEDARVLEGFSRAEPDDSVDVAMYLESLVACGRAQEAVLAWSHLGRGRGFDRPIARLAATRALLACGRYSDALEEILRLRWSAPLRGHHAAIDRLARMLALADLDDLLGVVEAQRERGATTLATLAAREIAAFVPDAHHPVIARAAAAGPTIAFDRTWLDGFLDVPGRADIDAWFDRCTADPTLSGADTLVEQWPDIRFAAIQADDSKGLAAVHGYILAQALCRYFAASTGAPSVMIGALRTVADEALLACSEHPGDLTQASIAALLAALNPFATLDPWLFGPWWTRLEHVLRLDERTHGHLSRWVEGAPALADRLVGPDQVSVLTLRAATLLRERPEGYAAEAASILARQIPGSGPSLAPAWAEAAFAEGGPGARDALLTAAWLSEGLDATAAVLGAQLLFSQQASEEAYALLCRGLGAWPTEAWRDEQLAQIQPLWEASDLDVPFAFGPAAEEATEALQQGDPARGEELLRWLLAIDPHNAEVHRNAGFAMAMQGKVEDALAHFAKASPDQDTQMASGVLFQTGHPMLALSVLDYACRWYTRAEQWLTFGAIAFQVMDNPRTVQAYANAWELDPEAFDTSNLNSYAGVLDEVGDAQTCERIARKLIDAAEGDPMWESNGWHHLACAMIGQGRLEEAMEYAQQALDENPLEDNIEVFTQTLERARSGARPETPPPLPPAVPRHDAYVDLEEGDIKAVLSHWTKNDAAPARIAVLRASRYRYGSDNYVSVTKTAKETAQALVVATRGTTDPEHALARAFALDVREQGSFPHDPPPSLGDRSTREAFYKEFRSRGGIIVGQPPIERVVFEDKEVCPGTAVPTTGAYVRLLRAMQDQAPSDVLASLGLTWAGYQEAAEAWGVALRRDEGLGEVLAAGLRA